MSKTAEEILIEVGFNAYVTAYMESVGETNLPEVEDLVKVTIQAMQSYADQEKQIEACEFGIWLLGNCDQSAICWYYEGEQKTTAELYQLFKSQTNK